MTATRLTAIGLLALAALAGCRAEKKRTEIVLGVATDLDAPAPLESVHMDVYRVSDDAIIGQQDWTISGVPTMVYELPGTYGVYSDEGNPDRFRVELRAWDDQKRLLVVRKAVLSLVPERTLFVRLGLVSACVGKTDCPDEDTCIDGRCASPEIDSTRLPDYQPGMESTLACTGATQYRNTGSRQPLPVAGGADACGNGTCSEGVCYAALPGAFTATTGSMTTARSASLQIGANLVTLADGRVLLAGGVGSGGTPVLASAEIFDPATGMFTATAGAMTVPRTYFGEAKLADGRVLIAGGINEGQAALASAEIFDPATGRFTAVSAPMTAARTFPAAVTLADGRVLIAGGINQIQSYSLGQVMYFGGLDTAEIFDPATGMFTATATAMVESRAFPQIVALDGGDAVVLCGQVQAGPRTTIERFTTATRRFGATATALPGGAASCVQNQPALFPDGRLLVTGSPNHAWIFDPQTGTFADSGTHPRALPGDVDIGLADGRVLFIGADPMSTMPGKEAYLFDPVTRSFAFTTGELDMARPGAMLGLLHSGDVLIAGGGDQATAQIFHR